MLKLIIVIGILGVGITQTMAQDSNTDPRIEQLAQKILVKIPDIKETIPFFGRKEERIVAARKHATAIIAASDKYAAQWDTFAVQAGWQHFNANTDLPALIAAITYRESTFRSVIRYNDNTIGTTVPARVASEKPEAYDSGVMQVRVPSRNGRECGVKGRADIPRLLKDLTYAYDVGTCILTQHIKYYVPTYSDTKQNKFKRGLRPDNELKFFGVIGERKDSVEASRARELVVIERYNWGDSDLYQHRTGAGYARRIIALYEFFRTS